MTKGIFVKILLIISFVVLFYPQDKIKAACIVGAFNYNDNPNQDCPWLGINEPDANVIRIWGRNDQADVTSKFQDILTNKQSGTIYVMPQNEPNIDEGKYESPDTVAERISWWVQEINNAEAQGLISPGEIKIMIPPYAHDMGSTIDSVLTDQTSVFSNLKGILGNNYVASDYVMGINLYTNPDSSLPLEQQVENIINAQMKIAKDNGIGQMIISEVGYTTHVPVQEGKVSIAEWMHNTAKIMKYLNDNAGRLGAIYTFTSLLFPEAQIPLYFDPTTGDYTFGCAGGKLQGKGNIYQEMPNINITSGNIGDLGCGIPPAFWEIPPTALLEYCSNAQDGKDSGSCAICEGGEIVIPKLIQLAQSIFNVNFIVNLKLRDDIFEGQVPDTKNEDLWNKDESHVVYLAGGDPRSNNFWNRSNKDIPQPPNISAHIVPGMEDQIPEDLGIERATETKIYIENAADNPLAGSSPPGLSLLDPNWNITTEIPKDCAASNSCYLPRVTPITAEDRSNNPGVYPGGDHNVFYLPSEGINVTPVEFTTGTDALRKEYEYKSINFNGANQNVYEATHYNSSGNHLVFVDNNTGKEVGTIYNFGNRYVDQNGEMHLGTHTSFMVTLEKCDSYEACIQGLSELPQPNNSASSKGGGPIITAQKELKTAGELSATFANNFFAPPHTTISMQGLLGYANPTQFDQTLIIAFNKKIQQENANYLSQNLSSQEIEKQVFEKVESNNIKSQINTSSSIYKPVVERIPTSKTSTETQKTFNIFGLFNRCAPGINGPKDDICSNESVRKPETSIFISKEKKCTGEGCSPGAGNVTSKIAIINDYLSGESVGPGGGEVTNYTTAQAMVEKVSESKETNPNDVGFIQTFNSVISTMVVPGQQLDETIPEELSLDFEVLPGSSFGGNFNVINGSYSVPGLGTTTKCANAFKGLATSPDDTTQELKVSNAIAGCYEESPY